MQIELLDTFLDLIETRSFHRTAERLHITQSTVSARVQVLEAAVGGRLFTRSRAGTNLSTEGLKFESHARALRHAWTEARRAVEPSSTAITLRIGIQNDLAAGQIGDWVSNFRKSLPECAFYIEPDYSVQMCRDLDRGALDFAVVYSPQSLPDLHIVSIGDIRYRLISSEGATRADISPARYIRGSYSAAFDTAHRQAMPDYSAALLASGQNAAVAGLLVANLSYVTGDIAFSAEPASATEAAALSVQPGTALFITERCTWGVDAPITWVRLSHAPGYRLQTLL